MRSKRSDIKKLLDLRLRNDPDPAQELIDRLMHIKRQAYFNKPEFLRMCGWKSPRPRHLYHSNSSAEVRRVSIKVFASESEREKIELLTSLKGVGIPTASAILTLTDPKEYGVIDIRVWQMLYQLGAVTTRSSGTGFSLDNWIEFLERLRYWARKFNRSVRDVERALFEHHRENQVGTLYRAVSKGRL